MIVRLYGVYDRKACDFRGPFYTSPNDGVAVRSVVDALEPSSALFKHAADFSVVCVGEMELFPDSEPVITAFPRLQRVVEVEVLVASASAAGGSSNGGDRAQIPLSLEA